VLGGQAFDPGDVLHGDPERPGPGHPGGRVRVPRGPARGPQRDPGGGPGVGAVGAAKNGRGGSIIIELARRTTLSCLFSRWLRSTSAQVSGWLLFTGDRRCVPPVAGRGRRRPPAGLDGQAHPACAAALLRLSALPRGDEPVRHPGTARSRLDRNHGPVHPRPQHARRGRLGRGQQRAADRWKGLVR
jgi:hypothetical protein